MNGPQSAVIMPFAMPERLSPVGVVYIPDQRPLEVHATQRIPDEEAEAFALFAADVMANVWPLVRARLKRVRSRQEAHDLYVTGLWAQPTAVRRVMARWR